MIVTDLREMISELHREGKRNPGKRFVKGKLEKLATALVEMLVESIKRKR